MFDGHREQTGGNHEEAQVGRFHQVFRPMRPEGLYRTAPREGGCNRAAGFRCSRCDRSGGGYRPGRCCISALRCLRHAHPMRSRSRSDKYLEIFSLLLPLKLSRGSLIPSRHVEPELTARPGRKTASSPPVLHLPEARSGRGRRGGTTRPPRLRCLRFRIMSKHGLAFLRGSRIIPKPYRLTIRRMPGIEAAHSGALLAWSCFPCLGSWRRRNRTT